MNVYRLTTVFDAYERSEGGLFATEEAAKQEAARRAGEELVWFDSESSRNGGHREWSTYGNWEEGWVREYAVEEVPVHDTVGPFGEEEN